jgi:hypothetical protein
MFRDSAAVTSGCSFTKKKIIYIYLHKGLYEQHFLRGNMMRDVYKVTAYVYRDGNGEE